MQLSGRGLDYPTGSHTSLSNFMWLLLYANVTHKNEMKFVARTADLKCLLFFVRIFSYSTLSLSARMLVKLNKLRLSYIFFTTIILFLPSGNVISTALNRVKIVYTQNQKSFGSQTFNTPIFLCFGGAKNTLVVPPNSRTTLKPNEITIIC